MFYLSCDWKIKVRATMHLVIILYSLLNQMREKSICGLYGVCFNLPCFTHLEMCIHFKTDNKRLSLMRDAGMAIHRDTSAENIVLPANSGYTFFLHCYSCNYL